MAHLLRRLWLLLSLLLLPTSVYADMVIVGNILAGVSRIETGVSTILTPAQLAHTVVINTNTAAPVVFQLSGNTAYAHIVQMSGLPGSGLTIWSTSTVIYGAGTDAVSGHTLFVNSGCTNQVFQVLSVGSSIYSISGTSTSGCPLIVQ